MTKWPNEDWQKVGKLQEHEMTCIALLGAHQRGRSGNDGDSARIEKDNEYDDELR